MLRKGKQFLVAPVVLLLYHASTYSEEYPSWHSRDIYYFNYNILYFLLGNNIISLLTGLGLIVIEHMSMRFIFVPHSHVIIEDSNLVAPQNFHHYFHQLTFPQHIACYIILYVLWLMLNTVFWVEENIPQFL